MKPLIIKLGGSAITDKSRKCTPNLRVIQRAVDLLAEFKGPLVLLHGGGSFAHPFVAKAGLHTGYRKRSQLLSISETELFLDQLTRIVAAGLLLKKRAFVPLKPMSFVISKNGVISKVFLDPLERALALGLVPLIHGDIVFDVVTRIGVLSADSLASFLGVRLNASRVLFGCDVDGVFSANPKENSGAELLDRVTQKNHRRVLDSLRRGKSPDATGGMLGKVKSAIECARKGVECSVLNIVKGPHFDDALKGRTFRGTRFVPWDQSQNLLAAMKSASDRSESL